MSVRTECLFCMRSSLVASISKVFWWCWSSSLRLELRAEYGALRGLAPSSPSWGDLSECCHECESLSLDRKSHNSRSCYILYELYITHTHSLTHSLTHSHTHIHTHTHTLSSLSLSLSHTHTHTRAHARTHTHARMRTSLLCTCITETG